MHRASNHETRPSTASRSSSHSNSSAFSSNANPNEDWTKISDLAERRRIQNRIAQRNYRKKLKRRLEDLEKRATSSDSPEQSPEEAEPPTPVSTKSRTRQRASKSTTADVNAKPLKSHVVQPGRPLPHEYYATTQDDRGALFAQQCTRQLSASPPPVFSYPPLPSYDAYRHPAYGPSPIYHTLPYAYGDMSFTTEYGEPVPSIVPVVSSAPGLVRKPHIYADEDIISPFSMSYASMAGIDLGAQQAGQADPSLPIVASLLLPSSTYAFTEDPRGPSTSPETSILTFPLTPESDPCSPRSLPAVFEYDLRP